MAAPATGLPDVTSQSKGYLGRRRGGGRSGQGHRVAVEHAGCFSYERRAWIKRQRFVEGLTSRCGQALLVLGHRHGSQHGSADITIQVSGERVGAQSADLSWPTLPEPDDGERLRHIPGPGPDFLAALAHLAQYPFDPAGSKVRKPGRPAWPGDHLPRQGVHDV